MARVTVEDCLKNVKNRFELVIIAAKRARQLMRGKEAKVEWDNDKPTVVALREIALGFTDVSGHEETHEEALPTPSVVIATVTATEIQEIVPEKHEESSSTDSPEQSQSHEE